MRRTVSLTVMLLALLVAALPARAQFEQVPVVGPETCGQFRSLLDMGAQAKGTPFEPLVDLGETIYASTCAGGGGSPEPPGGGDNPVCAQLLALLDMGAQAKGTPFEPLVDLGATIHETLCGADNTTPEDDTESPGPGGVENSSRDGSGSSPSPDSVQAAVVQDASASADGSMPRTGTGSMVVGSAMVLLGLALAARLLARRTSARAH